MRRPILLLVAVAMTAVLLARSAAPVAHACSGGGHPVETSDVIVAGRISGWSPIENATRFQGGPDIPFDDPNYYGPYDPIRVQLEVERVYKGNVPQRINLVDGSSLSGNQWWGASGACGAFDFDPTGKYVVFGLSIDDFGRYRSNRLLNFYIGDQPPTDYSSRFMTDLSVLLPGYAPSVAAEKSTDSDTSSLLPVAAAAGVAITLVVLLAAAFAWRRRAGT
jgi:hypothetical protein